MNLGAIVIAELMFNLLKRFAEGFGDKESCKGYCNKAYNREYYKRRLQSETCEQSREEQADNEIGNPYE